MTEAAISNVLIERQDRVLHLIINRPERKNALTQAMYAALADALNDANADSAIQVLVISGTQGEFSSGNDLKDFLQNTQLSDEHPTMRFMNALMDCQKPVIAAVGGSAIGIGTTLLLHCDLIYAGKSAIFQTPFVNLGLCPEYASSLLLPQRVGYPRAAEMLLLGASFDADKALTAGLVNAVLADDDVLRQALDTAQRLARQPARALYAAKRLLRQNQHEQIRQVIALEIEEFVTGLQSAEFKEAVDAFLSKRKPDFSRFQ